MDLQIGLVVPSGGRLLVNGLDLDPLHPELLLAWRAAIAHVTQSIYLADSLIVENIAFGIPKDQIDMELVRDAATQAQIASFIEGSAGGFNSFVGEGASGLAAEGKESVLPGRFINRRASWCLMRSKVT